MDPVSAWPVYVGAAVSLFGAIVSVVLPSVLENTRHRHTMEHLREQAEFARAAWLRERCLESYAAFIKLMDEALEAAYDDDDQRSDPDLIQQHFVKAFESALDTLQIIAPEESLRQARGFVAHYRATLDVAQLEKMRRHATAIKETFARDIQQS